MKSKSRRIATYAGSIVLVIVLTTVGVLVYTSFEQFRHENETSIGNKLYAENCASCHGVNLEGEPDWQTPNPDGILPAPPHDEDGHTWHHSDQLLANYIKLGGERALKLDGVVGFKSGMPAFESTLSESEITAVLDFIKSHWSEKTQNIQQERTKVEGELNQ